MVLQNIQGKKQSSIALGTENENSSGLQVEDDVNEQICRQENSAASVLCELEIRHRISIMQLSLTKDTIGIVAKLGRVDDDNLSRLLSEYLGTRTMLAIVCKTQESALNLETYDSKGSINKHAGLHGLGSAVGKALEGRFDVICLDNLRPYTGQFVEDDLQKKLNLLKPRLPNGECPPGFLGFVVNMITLDKLYLDCVTTDGYGLRETLFYCLFGHMQVYESRVQMMNAIPLISDGAVSLDGGLMRSTGIYTLGKREEVSVRFPKPSSVSSPQDGLAEIGRNVKKLEWEKEKLQEDIKREKMPLDGANHNFAKKQFLKSVAHSSQSAAQPCSDKKRKHSPQPCAEMPKRLWMPQETDSFVQWWYEEFLEGNFKGDGIPTVEAESRIEFKFESQFGYHLNFHPQMRTKIDSCKRDFREWYRIATRSGVKDIDWKTGRIVADKEWWTNILLESGRNKRFKYSGLKHVWMFNEMFGSAIRTTLDRSMAQTQKRRCNVGEGLSRDSSMDVPTANNDLRPSANQGIVKDFKMGTKFSTPVTSKIPHSAGSTSRLFEELHINTNGTKNQSQSKRAPHCLEHRTCRDIAQEEEEESTRRNFDRITSNKCTSSCKREEFAQILADIRLIEERPDVVAWAVVSMPAHLYLPLLQRAETSETRRKIILAEYARMNLGSICDK